MKMTDAEIKKQMETNVCVKPEKREDIERIIAYLKENGIEVPEHYPDPQYYPHPSVRYWPLSIDFVNKNSHEMAGVLACSCYSSGREIITVERFFRILEGKKPMKENEVKKIYFDMDGVLADFAKGVKDLCDMEAPSLGGPDKPEQDDEMWRRIKNVENFYNKLELMPNARELFDAVYEVYGDRVEILTGIPKEKRGITTAGQDKKDWIERVFSPKIKVNIVFREEKPKYCTGSGCILIDDMAKNIKEWNEMGGTGIQNEGAYSTILKLIDLGILDKSERQLHSGFDAPAKGIVLSADTVIKRNPDGTIELNS